MGWGRNMGTDLESASHQQHHGLSWAQREQAADMGWGRGGQGPQLTLFSRCPQLSGRWHSVALASNKSDLIRPQGHFRVLIHSMSAKDGNLHGDILIPWVQGTKGRGGAVELQGGWGWPW